jgi:hypothetical protein
VREPRIVRPGGVTRVDRLVGVAEQRRRVPGAPPGERDVVEAPVERGAVGDHPVVHLVHARVQRRSAGSAGRALAVVPGEAHTTGGELVEVRRADERVPGHRQALGSELVERDEQDVGPGRWHRAMLPCRRGSPPDAPL